MCFCGSEDDLAEPPSSLQATKKEPVDGSITRLALQSTSGAAKNRSRVIHPCQGVNDTSESSVKKISYYYTQREEVLSMRSVAVKSLFGYAIMNCDPVYTVNREQPFPDPIAAGRRKPTDTHVFLKNSHSAATSRAIAEC